MGAQVPVERVNARREIQQKGDADRKRGELLRNNGRKACVVQRTVPRSGHVTGWRSDPRGDKNSRSKRVGLESRRELLSLKRPNAAAQRLMAVAADRVPCHEQGTRLQLLRRRAEGRDGERGARRAFGDVAARSGL